MDPHPYPDRHGTPGSRFQRHLCIQRPCKRGGCCGEGCQHPVACGLDHRTTVVFDGRAEDGVVFSKGRPHFLGMLLPESGAPLDIGEQERGHSG